jgi:hypothetical protein
MTGDFLSDEPNENLSHDRNHVTIMAVRYKGNGTFMQSRGSLKRSLKVDFNKFVKGQE